MAELPQIKVDQLFLEDLAAHLCGLSDDTDSSEIEEALYIKFNVDFENFNSLISHLLPMIDYGKSALTDKRYKGFSKNAGEKFGEWIVKTEI